MASNISVFDYFRAVQQRRNTIVPKIKNLFETVPKIIWNTVFTHPKGLTSNYIQMDGSLKNINCHFN